MKTPEQRREYDRRWRAANRAREREVHRDYYNRNKAQLAAKRQLEPEKYIERDRKYYDTHRDEYHKRSAVYRKTKRYGLMSGEYETMWANQQGKCPICTTDLSRDKRTNIDHCHATGKVRALLCGHCNRGLGLFRDNSEILRNAANYILINTSLKDRANVRRTILGRFRRNLTTVGHS